MRAFKLIPLGFLALLGAASPLPALCAPTVTVIEYFDPASRKFFMTADPVEQQAIEATGQDSPLVRTGLQFTALPADVDTCETRASGQVVCAGSIVRFDYAAFPWFFYTPKPSEWAQLKAPDAGFIDRGVAFKAFLPDGPGNTCTQGRIAVNRSYRNQNHRFTADLATHQRMVATGSLNEGVTFCAESARINPLFDATYRADVRSTTQTEDECAVEAMSGPCVVTRNLQPPTFGEDYVMGGLPQVFLDRTGFPGPYFLSEGDASVSDRAFGTFAQFGLPGQLGLHVNTGNRIHQGPSGLDAAYNIDRYVAPGAVDTRLVPFWYTYDVPVELSMRFLLFVKEVDLFSAFSTTAGRLRIVLEDMSDRRLDVYPADRRLDFVVQLYGDRLPSDDHVGVEGASFTSLGHVTVTTSADRKTYGHLASPLPYLMVPGGFRSVNAWGYGGAYDYRIDLAALQRIIAAARQLDPTYSTDPGRYQVLSYRLENEVEGDGRLGVSTRDITLQLLRQ